MPSLAHFWIETCAILGALLVLPAYMGLIHVSPAGAVAYAAVGGVAMTIGEQLQFGLRRLSVALADVLLWGAAFLAAGGTAYVLALILI